MPEEIKRISVRIGGMSYQLVSAENEAYTRQLAAKADEMIRRVMQNNPQLSLSMSTVLALVNALDELSRTYLQFSSVDGQRQDTEKQAVETRKELMRLREQNWEMKKELLRLNRLCQDYEAMLVQDPDKLAPDGDPDTDTDDEAAEAVDEVADAPGQAIPAAPDDPALAGSPFNGLTQTNLDDYLRENGWPKPIGQDSYDH